MSDYLPEGGEQRPGEEVYPAPGEGLQWPGAAGVSAGAGGGAGDPLPAPSTRRPPARPVTRSKVQAAF